MSTPIIYWFRQDLRTADLPGLAAALATGRPVLPCYIFDTAAPGEASPGGASRWWLHYSLEALTDELQSLGGRLLLRRGPAQAILEELVTETGATSVFCSRMYEPWADALETTLHEAFSATDVEFKRYPGALLFEPSRVLNKSGAPFKVFTPFWRHCRYGAEPGPVKPLPQSLAWYKGPVSADALPDFKLRPEKPDWAHHWRELWQPGETGAKQALEAFLAGTIADYQEGRDHPSREATSKLSPHLHFGELSPRQVWHTALAAAHTNPELTDQVEKFLSELGWREFSYHLMHHFPHIQEAPFKPQFTHFPWLANDAALKAWQTGQTGYPIVDAGMRELWQTGYMHNRVRMVVASFLTKHLLIHWRSGAAWFWDTLVDADLANNTCSWQWVAGSGADASPYFRIFNPVMQGEKFDGEGHYIRKWVPELAAIPQRYLNKPWEAPAETLANANVALGETYPFPIVEHKQARESALAAYDQIKGV